ncbi:MAG: hypothetical protein P1V51_23290 [Deltaproteobacteria bacterium]|nr:hypothetical protein [Deltaproteobacteria bacterium]
MLAAPSREFDCLLAQLARVPSGTATLRDAHLDYAAVALRVHPFVIDATRSYLDAVDGWQDLHREVDAIDPKVVRVAEGALLDGESGEARALLDAAGDHPRGLDHLCDDAPEEVAATFGVHPYVVFRARGVLERRALCRRGA